jgi:hypothetical protein
VNTLNRQMTAVLFDNCPVGATTGYDALRARWSTLVNTPAQAPSCTAAHHLLYLILLGRDWRTAFTPICNTRKVANGGFYNWGLYHALGILHSPRQEAALLAPFAGIVTPIMLAKARILLPAAATILLAIEQDEGECEFYPGDAYSDEAVAAMGFVRKESK